MTLHPLTLFTTATFSAVYSLFSLAFPFVVVELVERAVDAVCRCFVPEAEGCVSAPEVNDVELDGPVPEDEPDDDAEDDADEGSLSESKTANSLTASGVENRAIDFCANLRAEGKLPAARCFCEMARQRRASSLLLSIVDRVPRAAALVVGEMEGRDCRRQRRLTWCERGESADWEICKGL